MDTPPRRIRQRVKVRVRAEKSDRRGEFKKWLRHTLNILFWAAVLAVVAIGLYWILKRFGNPPPLD